MISLEGYMTLYFRFWSVQLCMMCLCADLFRHLVSTLQIVFIHDHDRSLPRICQFNRWRDPQQKNLEVFILCRFQNQSMHFISDISFTYHRKLKKLTRRIIPNEFVKHKKPNKNDYDRTPLPKFTFGWSIKIQLRDRDKREYELLGLNSVRIGGL